MFEIASLPPRWGGGAGLIEELQYVDFIGADGIYEMDYPMWYSDLWLLPVLIMYFAIFFFPSMGEGLVKKTMDHSIPDL